MDKPVWWAFKQYCFCWWAKIEIRCCENSNMNDHINKISVINFFCLVRIISDLFVYGTASVQYKNFMSIDSLAWEYKKTVFCERCDLDHGLQYVDNVVNQILSLNKMCNIMCQRSFLLISVLLEFHIIWGVHWSVTCHSKQGIKLKI